MQRWPPQLGHTALHPLKSTQIQLNMDASATLISSQVQGGRAKMSQGPSLLSTARAWTPPTVSCWCVSREWQNFLEGQHSTLHTDHKSLIASSRNQQLQTCSSVVPPTSGREGGEKSMLSSSFEPGLTWLRSGHTSAQILELRSSFLSISWASRRVFNKKLQSIRNGYMYPKAVHH